jgi:hypothetical protein
MIVTKTAIAALALGFAVAAAASPASARSRSAHPGYDARAQATSNLNEMSLGADRVKALQECNQQASKFLDYSWGDTQFDHYRACMAERGQAE